MGKTLIIAEKPSLAKNIVNAIDKNMKPIAKNGKTYCYANDEYIVSFAFGHLLSLNDAEDYNSDWKEWNVDYLPIIPDKFMYKLQKDKSTGQVDTGVKEQFDQLCQMLNSTKVDKVVNAGDSDREGEIIIRNIITASGCTKPIYRLWMPDQTPKTIAAELAAMKPDSNYDNLANEGYARTFVDWLYGINLTRLATCKTNTLLRVGRVTTPIITAICERERSIKNFVKEKYYVPVHDVDGLKLVSENKSKTQGLCQITCDQYNSLPLTVTELKKTKKTMPRPKLYDLSGLQGDAGQFLKLAPKDTLDILQKLYEAGYTSYPRTNSQYMAVAEKDKAKDIINAIHAAVNTADEYAGLGAISFRDSKEIFDDSKIESHSGITPTTSIPKLSSLSEYEKNLYLLIINRFAAVFCTEEYVINRTNVTIANDEEEFKLVGDIVVTPGYTVFMKNTAANKPLPQLTKGQNIKPEFKPVEKETEPPKHFTADSLNKYLKNPYSKDEKKELSEDESNKEVINDIELGTEATRAGLIDNAIKSGYITYEKKSNRYGITEKGEFYVDTLGRLDIDMTKDRTLNLSKYLKMVYRREMIVSAVVEKAKEDLKDICSSAKSISVAQAAASESSGIGSTLCRCPKCGGNIVETKLSFSCKNKECGCVLFKSDKFLEKFHKKMTAELAKSFFEKGYADMQNLVSPKNPEKRFKARVIAVFPEDKKYVEYKLDFDAKPVPPGSKNPPPLSKPERVCACPKCGGNIIKAVSDGRKLYGCDNKCGVFIYKDKNKFMNTFGKEMTDDIAKTLLSGKTAVVEGMVSQKTGKTFTGKIKLDWSDKIAKLVWDV